MVSDRVEHSTDETSAGQGRHRRAHGAGQRGPAGPPPAAKVAAPIDVTGYWVSVVTEDWRYRMVVPPKGDYQSMPMTAESRRVADVWDPALFVGATHVTINTMGAGLSGVDAHLAVLRDLASSLKPGL